MSTFKAGDLVRIKAGAPEYPADGLVKGAVRKVTKAGPGGVHLDITPSGSPIGYYYNEEVEPVTIETTSPKPSSGIESLVEWLKRLHKGQCDVSIEAVLERLGYELMHIPARTEWVKKDK